MLYRFSTSLGVRTSDVIIAYVELPIFTSSLLSSQSRLLDHEKARCRDLEMQLADLEELRADERSRDAGRIRELERALEIARRRIDELTDRLNEPRYTEGPNVGVQVDLPDLEMVYECERLKALLRRVSEGGYVDGFLGGVHGNRTGVCEIRLPIDWSSRPYAVEVEVSIDDDRWAAAGMVQLGDGSEKGCSPTGGEVPLDLLMVADGGGDEVAGHFVMSLSDRGLFTIRLQQNHHGWDLRARLRYGSRVPRLEYLLRAAEEGNSRLQADVASLRDLEIALDNARSECGALGGEVASLREDLRATKAALAAERDANQRLEEGGAEMEANANSRLEEERRRGDSLQREIERLKRELEERLRRRSSMESGPAEKGEGKFQSRVSGSLMASNDDEVTRLREEVEILRRSTIRPSGRHEREEIIIKEGPTASRATIDESKTFTSLAAPASSSSVESRSRVLQSEVDRLRDELMAYERGWAPDLAPLLANARERATRAEVEVAELQTELKNRGMSGLTPMLEGERRRADLAEGEVLRLREELRNSTSSSQAFGSMGSDAMKRRAEAAEDESRRLRRELEQYERSESPDLAAVVTSERRRAQRLEKEVVRATDELQRLRDSASGMEGENIRAEYAEAELKRLQEDYAAVLNREQMRAERTEGEIRRLHDELEAFERGRDPDLALVIERERHRAARAEADVRTLQEELRRADVAHTSFGMRQNTSRSRSRSPDPFALEKESRRAQQAEAEVRRLREELWSIERSECPDLAPTLEAERRRAERAEAEVLQLVEDLRMSQSCGSCPLGPVLEDERRRAEWAEIEVSRLQQELCELRNYGLSSGSSGGFDMVSHLQQHIQVLRNDLDKALRDRYEESRRIRAR
ncbi:hypothetical protein FOL47_001455 [Perkinsus chesapeaki]|uniref:Uncharacterized protein n=1 Tax=Perkinsus chesapeaki TaxID=330153 RepID=A0A7J6KTB6_PERCH|nr:hypothetical protein FOL47_001455 [Perkinsus chesapeaki]